MLTGREAMLIDINGPPMPPGFIGFPIQPPMPPNVQPFSYPTVSNHGMKYLNL